MARRRHPGYVLLMTLVLLALAATALSGLARASLSRVLLALREQEELQRRWGTLSCRTTLLPVAEDLLRQTEKRTRQSARSLSANLKLGSQALELVVSDEQAKVNLNNVLDTRGPRGAELALYTLSRTGGGALTLHFRPSPRDAHGGRVGGMSWPLNAWGQVFEAPDPAALAPEQKKAQSTLDELTLWGDGKLNIRRASPAAIAQVASNLLDPTQSAKMVALQRQDPAMRTDDVLVAAGVAHANISRVESLLGSGSNCHSIWIVNRTPERARYTLAVREELSAEAGKHRDLVFVW